MGKVTINNNQSYIALAADSEKLGGLDASQYVLKNESVTSAPEILTLTQTEFEALTEQDVANHYADGIRTILVEGTTSSNEPIYLRIDENMNLSETQKQIAADNIGAAKLSNYTTTLTAAEFEALTTEELAALHANGVRQILVESAGGGEGEPLYLRVDVEMSLSDTQKAMARSNIGAAPDGYGLGTFAKHIDSADNITETGWYFTDVGTPNSYWWVIMHAQQANNTAVQLAMTHIATARAIVTRARAGDVWGEWEWLNPPMALNTEYRTTERYNGNPVYTIAFSTGALPNTQGTTATPDASITATKIVKFSALVKRESNSVFYDLPSFQYISTFYTALSPLHIGITTTTDLSLYSGHFQIWYTKD